MTFHPYSLISASACKGLGLGLGPRQVLGLELGLGLATALGLGLGLVLSLGLGLGLGMAGWLEAWREGPIPRGGGRGGPERRATEHIYRERER